jgi:carbon monoxide dehydrogenase subunit G
MRSLFFSSLLAVSVLGLPLVANADPGARDPAKDPEVARLLDAKKTLKWNRTIGSDRYGHAEALVDAPAEVVAKKAESFRQYKTFHHKFATARVVNKEGDQTDVYMRYPVQIGPMKIELHEVMRFSPMRKSGAAFVLEARGIKGDMKKGHTIITIKPVDAKHSLVELDVLLVPVLPAPQSFIDEELRDGAGDFVNGLKDRSQGWVGPVTSL